MCCISHTTVQRYFHTTPISHQMDNQMQTRPQTESLRSGVFKNGGLAQKPWEVKIGCTAVSHSEKDLESISASGKNIIFGLHAGKVTRKANRKVLLMIRRTGIDITAKVAGGALRGRTCGRGLGSQLVQSQMWLVQTRYDGIVPRAQPPQPCFHDPLNRCLA